MAKAAQSGAELNINLMPTERPSGPLGSLVHWTLTLGRYLIILTEIFALAIFFLGIKLTTDKNDLKEDIQILSSQVASQESFEQEFRRVQQKTLEIKNLRNKHLATSQAISKFLELLPQGLTLENFELKEGEIAFSGSFSSPAQLQTLVLSFSASKSIRGLDINELNHPTEKNPLYTFKAKANIVWTSLKEESGK